MAARSFRSSVRRRAAWSSLAAKDAASAWARACAASSVALRSFALAKRAESSSSDSFGREVPPVDERSPRTDLGGAGAEGPVGGATAEAGMAVAEAVLMVEAGAVALSVVEVVEVAALVADAAVEGVD